MNILFATPECAPYVKTGGLGDVSAALPATLAALGHDVRLLMPAYQGMNVKGEVGQTVEIPPCGPWPAAQLLPVKAENGVTLLLLACPSLYQRNGGPYVDASGRDYQDNILRFGFLSRIAALLGTPWSPLADWRAEVVHANDWPTALAPLFLAQARESLRQEPVAASVITIHNIAFQGVFPLDSADLLGIPGPWRGIDGVEFWGQLSMLKAGLQFADAITTVSPTYAREIQTEGFGVGLDGVLRAQARKLTGILNGIDTQAWNPASDTLLPHAYSATDLAGKARDKAALQARCGLAVQTQAPLFGVVSRLTPQKGIDLVLGALDAVLADGGQLVVLGQGDPGLQQALAEAAQRHPQQVSVTLGFDESLAHLIEAGADCFLMPSRFEPCGLNQMYSQAYGTPPLVTPTGGLADSVRDATADPQGGTGFVMRSAGGEGFAQALQRVRSAWADKALWHRIQVNGMTQAFGWEASATRYLDVYQQAIAAARGKDGMQQPDARGPAGQRVHQRAVVQLVRAHVVGQHRHARAVHHRHLQRQQVVRRVHGAMVEHVFAPARALQVPARAPVGGGHGDGGEPGQVLHFLRSPLALQQRRARQQQGLRFGELLDDQAAAFVQRGAHPQRHVDAFLHQVDHAVGHLHVDAHLRMLVQEQRHQRSDGGLRQRHRTGHADGAARLVLHHRHRLGGGLGLFAHGHAMAVEQFTGLRERQLARRALQQPHAQAPFQFGHPPGELGFRDVQGAAGSGKAALVHHLGEEQHVVQVLHEIVLFTGQSIPFSPTYQGIDPYPQSIP
jgi:starch synthase